MLSFSLHWEAEQLTQALCVLPSGSDAAFTHFLGCDGQEQQESGPVSVRSCPWRSQEVALEQRDVALAQGGDS